MGICASAPLIPEGLGTVIYDQKGLRNNREIKSGPSIHSVRGSKAINQDCAVFCQGYGSEDGVLCGVFDGHGRDGHLVSKIVSRILPSLLLDTNNTLPEVNEINSESHATNDISSLPNNLLKWKETYETAFPEMDLQLKTVKKMDFSFSGSTAVVALKQGDHLLIANLGDSRAILGTKAKDGVKAVQLTIDLKPGTPDEANRIVSSKGWVFALTDEPCAPRAWLPRDHDSFGIAVSRCFGDFVMKDYGIISTPVITHHQITSDDHFILLATDGVWDVLSNEEVASAVCAAESEELGAKAVVDAAVNAWKTKKVPNKNRDDCTAVCYLFRKKD